MLLSNTPPPCFYSQKLLLNIKWMNERIKTRPVAWNKDHSNFLQSPHYRVLNSPNSTWHAKVPESFSRFKPYQQRRKIQLSHGIKNNFRSFRAYWSDRGRSGFYKNLQRTNRNQVECLHCKGDGLFLHTGLALGFRTQQGPVASSGVSKAGKSCSLWEL